MEIKKGEERKKVRDQDVEVPSLEEVEEFFDVLRRMKVAVKYFELNGEGWRAALENAEVEVEEVVDEDDQDHKPELMKLKKKKNINNNNKLVGEEETRVLHMNPAAPEEAESNIFKGR